VAEVGEAPADDQMFHILYDGTVMDEQRWCVLGGEADAIDERLEGAWSDELDMASALRAAVDALTGPDRTLTAADIEVALLARTDDRRAFRRVEPPHITELLGD
jgi:proteasome alpha subunit